MLLLAGAAALLIWGLAGTNFVPLLAFGLSWGFIAGGWTSTWSAVITEAAPPSQDGGFADAVTLFGWFSLSRGVGNVASAPISSVLIGGAHMSAQYGYGVDDGRYGSTIVFVGAVMLIAGLIEVANGLNGPRTRKPR